MFYTKENKRVTQLPSYPVTQFNWSAGAQERRSARGGFTFIEMIIVVSMLSIVSLAMYATFSNGLRIYQKINTQIPEEDLNIFFDKFTSDLKNTCIFSSIKFSGTKNKVEVTTLINSPRLNKRTVGQVIYYYCPDSDTMCREQRDYSQIDCGAEGSLTYSIKNIKSSKFQYYVYDTQKKEYLWQDEWIEKEPPLAVRMELEFDNGTRIDKITKTVSIPVSS